LKDYLQESQGALTKAAPARDQGHGVLGKSTPLQEDSLEEGVPPPNANSTPGE